MKLLVFILATGLVSANISFNVGQEHVFKYNGKILNGIPEIDAHFSGITIAADILIQVVDATTYKLALKNVAFSQFHDRLDGPEPMNWRTLVTPAPGPVDPTFLPFLESPVVFKMVNGMMTDIKVSSNEPQWTINMKKGLLDLIKIQYPVIDNQIQQNMIVNSQKVLPNFFQVMEESIDGICENTYTVNEISAYLVKDPSSWTTGLFKPELCTNKKIFQITKVRDVTKCKKHNVYVSRSRMEKVIKAEAHITNYIGCGATKDEIMIHGAIHEGEVVQTLTNTEPIVTGVKQVLNLVEVRPILTNLPVIDAPRTLSTVLYEFPLKSDIFYQHELAAPFAKGAVTPATWKVVRTQIPSFRVHVIHTVIIKELKEIAVNVAEVENVAQKKLSSKLTNVLHNFLTLTAEEIKGLYLDIKKLDGVDLEVKQNVVALFMDVATMAGTTHSVQFLKYIVQTEQVNQVRILATIMNLGHHIRTPTVDILDNIFDMIKSPIVAKNKLIKHNALLNFANLLNKACTTKNELKKYPAEVFGEFCSSATAEIATKYIPYILTEFKTTADEEYKEVCLIALGTIGHEAIVPILLPYIQGKVAGHTVPIRVMTILALNNVLCKHRDILLPVYMTILDNPVEHKHVRIAALSMILKGEPTFVMMQKIAISTWYEKDPEMVKFIFATLKTLSGKEFENMIHDGYVKKIAGMARTVLPLAKPLPGMLFYSGSAFVTEYLKHLYAGYEAQTVFAITPHGNTVFHKMVVILDHVKLPALELALHLKGEKSLSEQLQEVFADVFGTSIKSNNAIWNALHVEWKKIVKEMKFTAREDIPFYTFLYMHVFEDMVAHIGANQVTLDALKPWIKKTVTPIIKDPRAVLQPLCNKKIPINFVHAHQAMSTEYVRVSGLGLPIVSKYHALHVFSLQGHIVLTGCDAGIPTVEVALKTKAIRNFQNFAGVVVPFTKEFVCVTSSNNLHVNKPVKLVTKIEPTMQKMEIKVIPFVAPTAAAVDGVYYHVRAFTCIRKVEDFAHDFANVKDIHVKTIPTKITKKIGGPVGLDLTFDLETESDLFDIKTIIDRAALFKYNPLNIILLPFDSMSAANRNGMPSSRFHKMTLLFNPAQSVTKEVHFNVELNIGKMIVNTEPIQYKIQYSPAFGIIEAPLNQANPVEAKLITAFKEKLNGQTNFAVHALFNVVMKGAADKAINIGLTAGLGLDKAIHKWHVHMEVMPQGYNIFHVCMDGSLDRPVIPAWNIEKLLATPIAFNFKKTIGFGNSCDQYLVNLNGITSVSEEQKTFSKSSPEAVQCQKSKLFSNNLKHKIQGILPSHGACHMQRDQAATLDHMILNLHFAKLPANIDVYQKTFVNFLKLLVLPHIEMNPLTWMAEPLTTNGAFKTTVKFNTELNTFTMNVITPTKTIALSNIRLPMELHGVIPLVAGKLIHKQVHEALTGAPFRPTCHITEVGHIQTFDERFYNYKLDDCYHIVAADCTVKFTTAVLAKAVAGVKHAKVYHMNNEFKLEFPTIFFNGQPVAILQDTEKVITSVDGFYSYTIKRTVDDVFILDTPVFVVGYNGQRIQIKSKQIKITGQMCGLCGDNNKDSRFDLRSPTACVYKDDLLAAFSYRYQTPECKVLPKEQTDLIAAEEAECAKAKIPITQPEMETDIGVRMKHYTIRNAQNQLCISKRPYSSCSNNFTAKSNTQLMIPYTCLIHPSNKVLKYYEQKVISGTILPELALLDTHMTIPTVVPQYCSRA